MISPCVFVLGGYGNIGYRIACEGARRGFQVKITTRQQIQSLPQVKNIEYIHTPPHQVQEPKLWRNLAQKHLKECPRVLIVNAIGGAEASPGETMEDLNINIPMTALYELLDEAYLKNMHKQTSVVQLSTIVAGRFDNAYSRTKREAELLMMQLPCQHATMLRMGHVVEPLIEKEVTHIIKDQHQFCVEQLSTLPFFPMFGDPYGSKKVLLQTVALEDIVKSVYNAFDRPPRVRIIDAVSSEVLTQEQFFKFHTDLLGKPFRPLYFPFEVAKLVVKRHPYGRLDPHVIDYLIKGGLVADHREFEKVVGSPLKTLAEAYAMKPEQELVIPRLPFLKYGKKVFNHLITVPDSRKDTWEAFKMALKALKNPDTLAPSFQKKVKYTILSEQKFNENSTQSRRENF